MAVKQNKHKVCHITSAHLGNDVRIYSREIQSLLKMSDIEITLIAPGNKAPENEIRYISLGKIPKNRLIRILRSQILGVYYILKIRADVWHFHDPELFLVMILLSLSRKKIVWDSHEDYLTQFRDKNTFRTYIPKFLRGIVSKVLIILMKSVDKRADLVIAATPTIGAAYKNRNIAIVGNQADFTNFSKVTPNFESQQILFIGNTESDHSFREVVESIQNMQTVKLVIAGRTFNREIKKWMEQKIGSRGKFIGWLDREQLAQEIGRSTIGLVTYENISTYSDSQSQPTKLFEFLMSGLPVVGTPIAVNKELISKSRGGEVSKKFDSASLEEAIRKILVSKARWNEYSRCGKLWAIKYGNWTESERVLLTSYKELLSKGLKI
jgi:glycosyltransferase involved in cell wall biosynthesis